MNKRSITIEFMATDEGQSKEAFHDMAEAIGKIAKLHTRDVVTRVLMRVEDGKETYRQWLS